jgi:hypothetical protein
LAKEESAWKPLITNAIAYAARLGARTVSLPEDIPSADLGNPAFFNIEGIELTTGYAAIAASTCLAASGETRGNSH